MQASPSQMHLPPAAHCYRQRTSGWRSLRGYAPVVTRKLWQLNPCRPRPPASGRSRHNGYLWGSEADIRSIVIISVARLTGPWLYRTMMNKAAVADWTNQAVWPGAQTNDASAQLSDWSVNHWKERCFRQARKISMLRRSLLDLFLAGGAAPRFRVRVAAEEHVRIPGPVPASS